eukprot:c21929_g5_i1.p1 GENE.c21929_g5_i1~~c21929_g5_i1.p1  ORF type:complete len:315 (-),score=118.43 c21929_g5_i1:141-1085(-)
MRTTSLIITIFFCFLLCDNVMSNTMSNSITIRTLQDKEESKIALGILAGVILFVILFAVADLFLVSRFMENKQTTGKEKPRIPIISRAIAKFFPNKPIEIKKPEVKVKLPEMTPMIPTKTFLSPPPLIDNNPKEKQQHQQEVIHSRLVGNYSPNKIENQKESNNYQSAFQTTLVGNQNVNIRNQNQINTLEASFQVERLVQKKPTLGEGLTSDDKQPLYEVVDIAEKPKVDSQTIKIDRIKIDPFDIFKEPKTINVKPEIAPEISWPSKDFLKTNKINKEVNQSSKVISPKSNDKLKQNDKIDKEWKPVLNFSD